MTKNTKIISAITIVTLFLFIIFNNNLTTQDFEFKNDKSISKEVRLSTTTIPVAVAGLVVPADEVTVRAQTAGILSFLAVEEGQNVSAKAILAKQSLPVMEAQVILAQTQSEMTNLQQTLANESAIKNSEGVSVRAYSANEIAQLRNDANNARINEVSNIVLDTAEANMLTAVEAINFVNNNRSIFTAEGLKTYDNVVFSLYGRMPNYFKGSVTSQNYNTNNVLEFFTETKNNPNRTAIDVQNLAALTEAQLKALSFLFTTAENDVFSRDKNVPTVIDEYLAKRGAIIEAQLRLQSVTPNLQTSIDSSLQDTVNQNTSVTIANSDKELAEIQAEYATRIKDQSKVVAKAAEGVAYAAESLGTIMAPFSGVITNVMVKRGAVLMPGETLFTIMGDDLREIEVTIPSSLISQIRVGQKFIVKEKVVGYVDRFSPYAIGGGAKLIISLTDDSYRIGESVIGEIAVDSAEEVYIIPRSYMQFSSAGPFINYKNGSSTAIEIIYDAGERVFIKVDDFQSELLEKNQSANF